MKTKKQTAKKADTEKLPVEPVLDTTSSDDDESGGKSKLTVEDPMIEPYYITVDNRNHAVHKRINSKFQMQAIGFYPSIVGALQKIAKMQTIKKLSEKKIVTVKEYITELDNTFARFEKAFAKYDINF